MNHQLALNYAMSLISLTLSRNNLYTHKEQRDEEVLLHVYDQDMSPTAEAKFFVRVQAHDTIEAAQAARSEDIPLMLYGKPIYLAQVVADETYGAVSSPLAKHLRFTKRDFQTLDSF